MRWIITLVICSTLGSVLLFPIFGPSVPLGLALFGVGPFLSMYAVSLWLNAKGHRLPATNLYLWGTFIGQLFVVYLVPELRTQALVSFVNLMLCAGFLKGQRSAMGMGIASLLAVTGSYIFGPLSIAWLPAIPTSNSWATVCVLSTLSTTCGLTYLGTRFSSDSMRRAKISQARAEEALAALEAVARAEVARTELAERLTAMAQSVVELRDRRAVAHQVTDTLIQGLAGAEFMVIDKRGQIVSISGRDPPTGQDILHGFMDSSMASGTSRALGPEQVARLCTILDVQPDSMGRIVGGVESSVYLLAVGLERVHEQPEWDWLLSAAWHVLSTGIRRIQVEQALSQSQRMDALGRLSAGIAHDFNNLLTSILGGAELVGSCLNEEDKASEYLSGMREAAERAAGLTTKLLAFSASSTGGPRDLDVVQLIEDLLPVLRGSLSETIELDVSLPDQEAWVRAEVVDLERALLNLVVNARNAVGASGEISLGVDIREGPEEGLAALVVIWVEDTGTGMDAEVQVRAFEPFFSTRSSHGAAGLGLSIVYGVVQSMGGEVMLSSELGEGTRVEISLPQRPAGESVKQKDTATSSRTIEHRILVVEDDPDVRDTICEMLGVGGYIVHTAEDGAEALLALEEQEAFSLILSDVVMPHMGGYELAQRLQELEQPPPLALVSGYAPTAQSEESGMDIPMITKPFSLKVLLDFVAHQVS